MALEFEWDKAETKKNLRKHAVQFDEATFAFFDALSVTNPDPDNLPVKIVLADAGKRDTKTKSSRHNA